MAGARAVLLLHDVQLLPTTIAALYGPLRGQFGHLPSFEYYYDLLYSIYSVPNIVLPLLGGTLVDRAGLYFSLNLFSLLILLGQITFALGCQFDSFYVMLLGRLIFGFGGESISVAQSALIERWFQSKELALGWARRSQSASRVRRLQRLLALPRMAVLLGGGRVVGGRNLSFLSFLCASKLQ